MGEELRGAAQIGFCCCGAVQEGSRHQVGRVGHGPEQPGELSGAVQVMDR